MTGQCDCFQLTKSRNNRGNNKNFRNGESSVSNYQIAFDYALADLRNCNPEIVVRNSLAQYQAENREYIVPFFKRPHVVSVETGEIYEQDTGHRSPLGVGTMIMHYLTFAQDITPSGRLISLKEVPGGAIFFPNFQKVVIRTLAQTFGQNLEEFLQCAAKMGGEKIPMGHIAAKFEAFPKVPLIITLWSGDEEVPDSANFLFDSTVEYFSPTETIIEYGYFLTHKLSNYFQSTRCAANIKNDPLRD